MPLQSTVLFSTPQSEIAEHLRQEAYEAESIEIVTGFATVEGVKVFEPALSNRPNSLKTLVVGAATYKAFEALDELVGMGVPIVNLHVHLGHTRPTSSQKARHAFYRYHPMLHSKIYYFEFADGRACAFIGSHNITGFALKGLNGEAAVLIEGPMDDPEFDKVREHIQHARAEATSYEPSMKEAYSWWTTEFLEGLLQKANDTPREDDPSRTILIFCEHTGQLPNINDLLYFELNEEIAKVQSLRAEVHLFIFERLPSTPFECLARLEQARMSFWCLIEGIENNKGGLELQADWYFENPSRPVLLPTPDPFRPTPPPGMQQIRIRLRNAVYHRYEYFFGKKLQKWEPVFNHSKTLQYEESYALTVQKLNLIPPESNEYYLVIGLRSPEQADGKPVSRYEAALETMKPESGAFILVSTRRREKTKVADGKAKL